MSIAEYHHCKSMDIYDISVEIQDISDTTMCWPGVAVATTETLLATPTGSLIYNHKLNA